MSNITLNFHDVRDISTKLRQINGQWHRQITFDTAGVATTITLYVEDEAAMTEEPAEYIRLPDYDVQIERSNEPFAPQEGLSA